jgi:hypothetical protein
MIKFLKAFWVLLIVYSLAIVIGSLVRLLSVECSYPNKFSVNQIFRNNSIEYSCYYCDYKLSSYKVDCDKYFDFLEQEEKERQVNEKKKLRKSLSKINQAVVEVEK